MGRLHFGLLCVAVTLVAAFVATQLNGQSQPTPQISWRKDLFKAHEESLKTQKPLLIMIGADWCHYTNKLETETLNRPEIVGLVREKFVPLYLDFDQHIREARILEIKTLPTTIVLNDRADQLGRIVGFQTPEKYRQELEKVLAEYQQPQFALPR